MKTINRELKAKVGSAYGYGWAILKEKFISLFIISIILGIAGAPMAVMQGSRDMNLFHAVLIVFGIAYSFFVLNPLKFGAKWANLKIIRHEEFDIKDMFDGFKNYLNVILAALIKSVIVGFGFAFFLVPGIIFACRLAFVPYLVMDKKLDPIKAVEESWRLTKGHGWKIFAMGLLSILIFIGGLLVFIFGVFISVLWIRAAFAALYEAVILESETEDIKDATVVIDQV